VSSPGVAPTGTVEFVDGTTIIGTGTITNGVASFVTSALAAGSHSITAVYTGGGNYTTSTSAAVVESVGDFSVASGSASQTVTLGGTVTFPLTVTPVGSATLAGAVVFTVSGVPAGASVSFAPATLAAGAGTTNVTLTIVAPAQLAMLERQRRGGLGSREKLGGMALALLLLPFSGRLRKRAGRLSRGVSLGLLLLAGTMTAMGVSGCGSGSPATSQESFTLTVNGTSGTLLHSTTVSLTVK